MRENHTLKYFNSLITMAFACAVTMVCGACQKNPVEASNPIESPAVPPAAQNVPEETIENPEEHDYVRKQMAAVIVTVPPNLQDNPMARQTYIYMALSAAAVGLCTDDRNFESTDSDEQAQEVERGQEGMLGQEIVEYITDLPTDNVDPAAARATTMLADNFDAISSYNDAVNSRILGTEIKWGEAFIKVMSAINATEDPDFNQIGDKFASEGGLGDVVTIKDVSSGYAKMQNIAHRTHDSLSTVQQALTVKYHGDFPIIPLNTAYASHCNLPWYF